MKITKLELGAGIWAVGSITLVGLVVSTVEKPAIHLTLIFAILLVTGMASAYAVLNSVRKVGRAGGRSAALTRRQLHVSTVALSKIERAVGDSEAARARAASAENTKLNILGQAIRDSEAARGRAATKVNQRITTLGRAVADSEAARARAIVKVNNQLNTVTADVRQLEVLIEEVQRLSLASRDTMIRQSGDSVQLADSFTRQTVKLELYVDEMRDILRRIAPSHKQVVLESITAD